MATYSPEDIILSLKGIRIDGFAPGTFVTAARDTDTWSDEAGALGDVTRVQSLDKRGSITFVTQKEAAINAVLSALRVSDENSRGGKGVAELTNLNSDTLHFSQEAWLLKPPDDAYSDAADTLEWTIRCAKLEMFHGGSFT